MESIKQWASDDRPREKMIMKGAGSLSDSELLAILINNGSKEKCAVTLSKELLLLAKNNLQQLGRLSIRELQQIKGIGVAKAVTIAAALELGRRRQSGPLAEVPVVRSSAEVASYIKPYMRDLNYEVFGILLLNRANKIKHFEIMSKGGITGTIADPRLILKRAVEKEATSIILTHNHPSGNLRPSKTDEELTSRLKTAAAYFDILILDHIIVSDEGYFSFADEGMM